MLSRLNITAKGLMLVLLPVGFQIVFALVFISILINSSASLNGIQHSLSAMSNMSRAYGETISNICVALNRDADIETRVEAFDALEKSTDWLDSGVDSEKRFPELEYVEADVNAFHSSLVKASHHVKAVISSPNYNPYRDRNIINLQEVVPLFLEAQAINDRLFGIERQMVSAQPEELKRFRPMFLGWLSAALLGSCIISVWLGKVFSQDIVVRLNKVTDQATRILVGEALSNPLPGKDEIADLERILFETSGALAESRRREMAVMATSTHMFCAVDRSLRLQKIVIDAQKALGFDEDELRGRSVLSLLTHDTKDETNRSFENLAKNGGTAQIENVVRSKSGALKTFAWTVNWAPVEQLFFCVVRDVTELRSLEKLKQNFLAMASNDLAVPLDAINKSLAQLGKGEFGELPSGAVKRIEMALRNNERLTNLLEELMDFEKLSTGKAKLQFERASVLRICGSAGDQLRDLAEKSSIEIVMPENEAEVFVDPGRITQVVVNLLSNAIKFSPSNSRIVFDVKDSGGFVEIGIADSGPGIPREHLGLIFSRFHQVKSGSVNKGVKGSGLGLAIVQSLVKEHGGSVGVESAVGHGSRFWIRVPSSDLSSTSQRSEA